MKTDLAKLCENLREQDAYEANLDLKSELTLLGYQPPASGSAPQRISWHEPQASQTEQPGGVYVGVLRRYTPAARNLPPLLLVHGASAWRATFFEPEGGLVRHLRQRFDVWTLDWRCSKVIVDLWRRESPKAVPEAIREMNLDHTAQIELPAAVARIGAICKRPPRLVGHCMGAAVVALAIARRSVRADARACEACDLLKPTRELPAVGGSEGVPAIDRHVVLSTIGLFYRGGVDNWFRAEDRFDEKKVGDWCIYPGAEEWPSSYERFFKLWCKSPYRHCNINFCQRISCLLGSPYRPDDIGYLHDEDGEGLFAQFGAMPFSLLRHCAENIRRGWIAPQGSPGPDTRDLAQRENFRGLCMRLITGSENQLWHRDSIDRMYEWLRRDRQVLTTKRVFDRYGHQDLWWSPYSSAPGGVYDYVAEALHA
jgi:pimeloyl-ACP methyl ester carboxylesterase